MGNADFCSRFPLDVEVPKAIEPNYVNSLNFSSELPLNFSNIAKESEKDKCLQQIKYFIIHGWPERMEKCLRDIYSQHQDLEIVEGCLIFQDRIIIPSSLQNKILKMLHANHAGVIKMKQLARRCVYWFGINRDIENYIKNCDICLKMASVPGQNITYEWVRTTRPFSRIHADFFYYERNTFLLIVDSYSKWLEVIWMKYGTDAEKTIKKFQNFFTRFGLPDVVVTDNGPPFNSQYFTHFLERQGVRVMKSPPYHPQSNGQAERLVRVTKEILKKFLLDPETRNLSLQDKLDYFLFNYRNSCLTEGGDFPSERVFNYKPKTLLDLTNPNKHYKQMLQQSTAENTERYPQFEKSITDPFVKLVAGDKVYYKNHKLNETQKWVEAKFIKRLSTNIFQISIGSVLVSAHRGQIRLTGNSERRRNLAFQMVDQAAQSRGTKRRRNDSEDDEPFYGFPLSLEMLPPIRSEVHPKVFRSSERQDVGVSSCSNRRKSTNILRRSARATKKKFEKDYVYFK